MPRETLYDTYQRLGLEASDAKPYHRSQQSSFDMDYSSQHAPSGSFTTTRFIAPTAVMYDPSTTHREPDTDAARSGLAASATQRHHSRPPDSAAQPHSSPVRETTPTQRRSTRKRKKAPTKPAKRRTTSGKSTGRPPLSGRPHHVNYTICGAEARHTRDLHLKRIFENWGTSPDRWMPPDMLPTGCIAPGRHEKKPLEPRDWSTHLLADLAYLSGLTSGKPERIYAVLQDARRRRTRGLQGQRVGYDDVGYATGVCEKGIYVFPASETDGTRTAGGEDASMDAGESAVHVAERRRHLRRRPRPERTASTPSAADTSASIRREGQPTVSASHQPTASASSHNVQTNNAKPAWQYAERWQKVEELKLAMEAKQTELRFVQERNEVLASMREYGGEEDPIEL